MPRFLARLRRAVKASVRSYRVAIVLWLEVIPTLTDLKSDPQVPAKHKQQISQALTSIQ